MKDKIASVWFVLMVCLYKLDLVRVNSAKRGHKAPGPYLPNQVSGAAWSYEGLRVNTGSNRESSSSILSRKPWSFPHKTH